MNRELNYLFHVAEESNRFAAALHAVDAGTPVPPCPGWTAADLLWHLGEVQWFWTTIVAERPALPEELVTPDPARPDDLAALRAFSAQQSHHLLEALRSALPTQTCWTWAKEQTVGCIYRRQAHEALIHRIDAELTAGQ